MTACSGANQGENAAPSATTSTEAKPVDLKTSAEAKKTVEAFFAQVSADLQTYDVELASKKTPAEQDALFAEAFKKSSAFLKPGAFTPAQEKAAIEPFASIYMYDNAAKIEADESKYVLSGDTVTVKGTDFKLTIGGKVQEQKPDNGKSGSITLTFADNKWLITGFDTGQ